MVTTTHTAGLVKLTHGRFSAALPVGQILAVERADRVRPGLSPGDPGVLSNRLGEFRVFALGDLFGAADADPRRTGQVVLVEHAGERIGFRVDKVAPLPRTGDIRLTDPPPGGAVRFAATALLDDGPLPVLDLAALLGESSEPEAPRPAPPRMAARVPAGASNRVLVVGQFEYPAPGGRTVGFGLSAGCVDEVTEAGEARPVPGAPPHVVGWVGWRGRAVSKIDPAVWCGFAHRTPESGRVVLVRTASGGRVAVAAGFGVRVIHSDAPHVPSRLPLALDPQRVLGAYEFHGLTVVVPKLDEVDVSPTTDR